MVMNLDNSYIGPYLKDWLKYLKDSDSAEQQVISSGDEFRIPYSGVQQEMINYVFIISNRFNIKPHARYLAVHLLDRYVCNLFYELITNNGKSLELTEDKVRQVSEKIAGQMKLILVTCIQIASKVDLLETGLGIVQVQSILQLIDKEREYNKTSIFNCEINILLSLDFRLPVSVPIYALELFLAYADLTSTSGIWDTCLNLLDITYLRHEELYEQLHLMARGRNYNKSRKDCRDFLALETNSAFIAAAVVVCSNFFFHLKRKVVDTLASKLAKVIDMSPIDINMMANILFSYAIDEEDFKEIQAKLKKHNKDDD